MFALNFGIPLSDPCSGDGSQEPVLPLLSTGSHFRTGPHPQGRFRPRRGGLLQRGGGEPVEEGHEQDAAQADAEGK